MAMRFTQKRPSSLIMHEFIDPSYLANKRPAIPGGSWPKDLLRKKSFADLQQLWFALVKEKNMLSTTKHHYVVHQEELGAFPAPSRVQMVDESMVNIKAVVQERDFEATDRAVAIFRERVKQGIYRYPPGPQPPANHNVDISIVKLSLSKKVSVERLRELFGKYDVFESHKGIADITVALNDDAMKQKREAELQWRSYMQARKTYEGYHAFDEVDSIFDHASAELAPGTYQGASSGPEGAGPSETLRAAAMEIPEPMGEAEAPTKPLERLRWMDKPAYQRNAVNYRYFPVNSTEAPNSPPERSVHPDEIEGPWEVTITYDKADGYGYAMGLEISAIDGAEVLNIEEVAFDKPFASRCPIYQEAVEKDAADIAITHQWPHIPEWKGQYAEWTKKKLADVIMYNYSNTIDYVDREVLLTGKSSWEMPIAIDRSCGGAFNVPAHAKPNLSGKKFSQREFHKLK